MLLLYPGELYRLLGASSVISVVSHRQSKTLINNTVLEVDDMDSFIELYEIVKSRPQCQRILQDYSYNDIVKIQITEQTHASASIEVSPNMKIGTCEDLNCKFIQFHISSKESIPKTSPCDPHKPNAFAVMLAAQNELQLPPKPVGEKLNGPQRLLSDIITWISNFDKGWTKDVLETGSVVCKKFSNALWFIDHCYQKIENNGCPIPQALKRFHGYSDYKKSHHVPPTITSEKLNEHCMELTKCLSFPSMTTACRA